MKRWSRLFYYLLINVFVSACTTLLVLVVWSRLQSPAPSLSVGFSLPGKVEAQTAVINTPSGGSIPQAPSVTATPSPTPEPTQSVLEYQIKQNDTLGELARKYDLSVEELMALNGLDDPNSLSVGQIIYIPVTPMPTKVVTPTATKAPELGDTTAGPAPEARVVINSVLGVGDITSERVFLTRTGAGALSLANWQLRDEDGNGFVFPQLELYEGGAVHVWTTSGVPTVVDLYWGLQSSVWQSGELVTLLDDQGQEHATYTIP